MLCRIKLIGMVNTGMSASPSGWERREGRTNGSIGKLIVSAQQTALVIRNNRQWDRRECQAIKPVDAFDALAAYGFAMSIWSGAGATGALVTCFTGRLPSIIVPSPIKKVKKAGIRNFS